jgi:hypothetical protein
MLDLRRLRLLSELARRGTIAEVARVVGYTPSAIIGVSALAATPARPAAPPSALVDRVYRG